MATMWLTFLVAVVNGIQNNVKFMKFLILHNEKTQRNMNGIRNPISSPDGMLRFTAEVTVAKLYFSWQSARCSINRIT